MRGSFKEVVRRKQRPFWQIVLIVLAAVIGVNILITSSNLLGPKYAGIASIVILAVAITLCGLILSRLIAYYSYRVADDKLIFERNFGKKSKIVLMIELSDIISIKPYSEVEEDKSVIATHKFICDKDYENFYVGEFKKEGKKHRFIIKPSSRFINILTRNTQMS